MKNNIEFGATCLGFAGMAATWWRMKPYEDTLMKKYRREPQITILVAESTDENGYTPASSVNVSGAGALRLLRAAIDEALKYEGEGEQP